VTAFGVLFLSVLFFFTEINTRITGQSTVVLYKRGTEFDELPTAEDDVETGPKSKTNTLPPSGRNSQVLMDKIEGEDVFSFSHVNYTIVTPDGHKQLLEDVSGYVAPGKLTALMGESGAGKVNISLKHDY
jgi:ATP-binding cassette subfamily G (WHITE) protein 2 (SNQ2)